MIYQLKTFVFHFAISLLIGFFVAKRL